MTDRRWHKADCDTDHYLVIAEVREILSVRKQAAQKFDVERFNLKKLSELEVKNVIRMKFQGGLQLWRT